MNRLLGVALLLVSVLAFGDVGLTQVNDVSFLATGPAGLKINGKTDKLEVKSEGDDVLLRVPLDTVDTGIDLRNRHMKEKYLDTKAHPFAELKVPKAMLKEGQGQKGSGTFTVHGTSKPVAVVYDVAKTGDGYSVKGEFDINIKAHGIEVPSYLGVTVKPDVKVVAAFAVKP